MSEEQWEPLSFDDERFKIYPDQFHIFENYGQSNDELPETYLTKVDFDANRFNQNNIRPENFDSIRVISKNDSSDEEIDDDIKNIKQLEINEQEQIRLMRNIGLQPNARSYVDSRKTAPCLTRPAQIKQINGPPIILDDSFFKLDPLDLKEESTISESELSTIKTLSTDLSKVSLDSTSEEQSSSSIELKKKPKSIHDILKIAKIPPPPPKQKTRMDRFKEEFPSLTASKKKNKKKCKLESEELWKWN